VYHEGARKVVVNVIFETVKTLVLVAELWKRVWLRQTH